MSEATLEEVHEAVRELRLEVEKKNKDLAKIEKIEGFLDTQEDQNQQLVKAEAEIKSQKTTLSDLKEELEASGKQTDEVKSQIDDLEVKMARVGSNQTSDYRDGEEYKAFNDFCRKGNGASTETKALLRTDSGVEGGFLVPTELDSVIIKKIVEIDGIRAIARVRTIAGKTLDMPIRDTIPTATYEGEAEEGTSDASTYASEQVTPFRQTVTVPITTDMLQDSAFNMGSEIVSDVATAFAFGEGNGFVAGTGIKQPEGFTVNAVIQAAARNSGSASTITPNSLILVTGDLKVGYAPTYVFNRRTLATVRTFRGDAASASDQAGQYLWQPGLNGPVSNTLNGFPYVIANSMPDIAGNAYPVAFGDFSRGYVIVDRTSTVVIRDDLTRKKEAIVEFTVNRWNTGRVVLEEAIKLIKVAA
jgi:HK97 family phage major capsid protein